MTLPGHITVPRRKSDTTESASQNSSTQSKGLKFDHHPFYWMLFVALCLEGGL